MNGLLTLIQAIALWLIFAIGFVVMSVLTIFWWPFFIPIALVMGIYDTIKNK